MSQSELPELWPVEGRIFAWRYDTKKNYTIYALFILFVISILFCFGLCIFKFSTFDIVPAKYKLIDEKNFVVFYKVDEKVVHHKCLFYPYYNPYEIISKDTVMIKDDNKPLCPEESMNLFYTLVLLTFGVIVFLPLGCIVYYDARQFWKNVDKLLAYFKSKNS